MNRNAQVCSDAMSGSHLHPEQFFTWTNSLSTPALLPFSSYVLQWLNVCLVTICFFLQPQCCAILKKKKKHPSACVQNARVLLFKDFGCDFSQKVRIAGIFAPLQCKHESEVNVTQVIETKLWESCDDWLKMQH